MNRVFLLVVWAAACTSSAPAPAPPPSPAPTAAVNAPPPPPAPAAPSRWQIAAPTAAAAFTFDSRAVFSSRADTLARTDTSSAHITLRVVPRGAALDVTVNGFSLVSTASQPLSLPAASRAVGRFDANGAIAFEGPGQSSCTALTSAAFEATRDLWVKWPADVVIGTRWRDSGTVAACRDGIPLRVTIVRNYRVSAVATDSVQTMEIERQSRVTIDGRGSLRGDTVMVTGQGMGTATLRVAPRSGWMIEGTGSNALQLRATGKSRTQLLDQHVDFTFRRN